MSSREYDHPRRDQVISGMPYYYHQNALGFLHRNFVKILQGIACLRAIKLKIIATGYICLSGNKSNLSITG